MNIDSKLDLVLKKELDVTPGEAFKAWTTPEILCEWFCPLPWKVVKAEVDLRPGGKLFTVMRSPEGQEFPVTGCILEVIPDKKLVWTSTLLPDFRPRPPSEELPFTANIFLDERNGKTLYTAIAMHGTEEACHKHKEMGFEQGWSICADQLVSAMKKRR